MSNLGLKKFVESYTINLKQTNVGDRYVLEEMLKNNYNLGGEQSGHVIFLDYNPTGDGILTSLMLIKILLEKKIKASDLFGEIKVFPQVMVNAKVSENKKNDFNTNSDIQSAVQKIEKEFMENGRTLIRASGTEPLIRVMIEGEDVDYITNKANDLAKLIEEKLN